RRNLKTILTFVPCVAIAGAWQMPGLLHLAGRWRFNGSLFEVLVWLFGRETPHQVAGVWVVYDPPKRIAAVALVAVIVWTIVRRYRPSRAAMTVAGAVLLLSTTVH